jgi:hypothetical protein
MTNDTLKLTDQKVLKRAQRAGRGSLADSRTGSIRGLRDRRLYRSIDRRGGKRMRGIMRWPLLCLIFLVGCSAPVKPIPTSTLVPVSPITQTPVQEPTPVDRPAVDVLYPRPDSVLEMGQSVKFTVRVRNTKGDIVSRAQVTITIHDPGGNTIAAIPAVSDSEAVYRTKAWVIPHRTWEGTWGMALEARADYAQGSGSGSFQVKASMSEVLLNKYGFWLEAPGLKSIVPQLVAERGDARNGMIRWGGTIPAQHVQPENWVEVHWREGDYHLKNDEAVRQFMLEELGDLGFTPVRDIGPFQPVQFKHWNGWQGGAQAQLPYDQMEWMIFYSPEVNKTYAIATTVVLPPTGLDPHAMLRESFAIFPDVHAAGVAPEPLPKLLPGPVLLSPPLAARFQGLGLPIVLEWKPVKELAKDEYYEVLVDYNYQESNPMVKLTTRQTNITLPEALYRTPNCHVFNWKVTLKRQTGMDDAGQPKGDPISYSSLYWYLLWTYPPGEKEPFIMACPNAQF